jgi:PadR family transcriptional regulator PadR
MKFTINMWPVLAEVFNAPNRECRLDNLATATGMTTTTVAETVTRFVNAEWFTERLDGPQHHPHRYVRLVDKRAGLAERLLTSRGMVRAGGEDGEHWPALASRPDGTWDVFCTGCSDTPGDHTYPCRAGQWTAPIPPAVVIARYSPGEPRAVTPRITAQVCAVLEILADAPEREHHGWKISKATGLTPSTVTAIMTRLAAAQWVTDRREETDSRDERRPVRRYYRLVPEYLEPVREVLRSRGTKLVPVTSA